MRGRALPPAEGPDRDADRPQGSRWQEALTMDKLGVVQSGGGDPGPAGTSRIAGGQPWKQALARLVAPRVRLPGREEWP